MKHKSMKTTIVKCDVCGGTEKVESNLEIPVIWTVEDTEGHATNPYLQINHLDICGPCMYHLCEGNFIYCDSVDVYRFRKL